MRFRFNPNPFLSHLIKRKGVIDCLEEFHALIIGSIVTTVLVSFKSMLVTSMFLMFLCPPLIAASVLMPAFIGIFSLVTTSSHLQKEQSTLLYLTNLSNYDIAWAYVFSAIYRLKNWIIIIVVFVPFTAAMIVIAESLFQLGFDNYGCFYSPLGILHCSQPPSSTSEIYFWFGFTCVGIVINQFGIMSLASVVGVAAALRLKLSLVSIVSVISVTLIFSGFVWLIHLDQAYMAFDEGTVVNKVLLIAFVLVSSISPYLLAFVVGKLTAKWANPS